MNDFRLDFLGLKLFLFFLIVLFPLNSIVFAQQVKFDSSEIKYLDIKIGDLCIVCDMPIDEDSGIAFLFDGRRVTNDFQHVKQFWENPEKYFYKLRSNTALYDEGFFAKHQVSYNWFFVGLWILLALISSALCTNIAMRKGLNIKRWFLTGLLTNIFGLIYLLTLSKNHSVYLPDNLGKIALTNTPVKCSRCEEYNHPSAKKCSNCGLLLDPGMESETTKI